EVHGDDDGADGDAEEADHDRLDERQKTRDGRVDFLLVEVRDLAEHGVERAGLLADADHLRDHVGEHVGRLQRLDDGFAALDADANLVDRLFEYDITGGARRDVERLQDRHARREQRRQRARKPGDRDLAQNPTHDWNLQQKRVNLPVPLRRLVVVADGYHRGDDAPQDDEAADACEEVADADDDARRERELFAGAEQAREDVLERGDDEDHDDRDDADGDDDDSRRVDHRGDYVAAQLHDLLDVGRETLEDEVEYAARL